MKKSALTVITSLLIAATMSMTAWATTAEEVIAKNPTSYTAGAQSVYGPKLTQEQLNAVANVVSDFSTNYVNSSMSNDDKIRAGYNYIKNNITYIDWRESTYANTAYGALVEKKAACSGMTRAFVALMDAVDVKAYWIHAADNSHQWNIVEFNDGFYHIDIDANIASGFEAIYKSSTHPYTYDTAAYPAIGTHSAEYGSGTQTVNNGWKEENGKWYYYENGNKAVNKWIDGLYYVGPDGAMLVNTTTPDGYQVGADGAWIQEAQNTTPQPTDGQHTMRASDPSLHSIGITIAGRTELHERTTYNGVNCILLDEDEFTFKLESNENVIDPNGHEIWVGGYAFYNGIPFAIGEPKIYPFEYDKEFTLDYTGTHSTATSLYNYCKQNDLIITINIVDVPAFGIADHNSLELCMKYK